MLRNENELEGVIPFDALVKLESLGKCRLYVRTNYSIGLPTDCNLQSVTSVTINLEVNSMSGNATRLCSGLASASRQLDTFITDCATSVTCPCCTSCA